MLFNIKNSVKIKSPGVDLRGKFGKNVRIDESVLFDGNSEVGDFSYINSYSSVENTKIGRFCSISSNVTINPFEHDLSLISTHPILYDKKYGNYLSKSNKPVVIGDDVLISKGVIILEGVTIGTGAVIGAGAVVVKDVKPYEVVAGVPAKHIKYRFNEERISSLLDMWNFPTDKVVRIMKETKDARLKENNDF